MNTAELQNARVFVGNLPWSVTDDELNEHMSQAGSVVSCTVLRDTNGRSRGGAVVEFASISDAQNAIDTLTDVDFAGRPLFLREDREENAPAPRPEVTGSAQSRRVYIGNLSWDVAWQDLKDHMRQAGNVIRSDVMTDFSGRSRGCGIVEYSSPEEAQTAIETLSDTELMGRSIFVREDRETRETSSRGGRGGRGGSGRGENARVYVGNLTSEVTWQDLKDHMRQAGNVMHVDIPTDSEGVSKGFAIVEYENGRAASRAIREVNNTFLKGEQIYVREDRANRRRRS
jgi:RNA recognition motif-containing protein